jgi:hypothetical protein
MMIWKWLSLESLGESAGHDIFKNSSSFGYFPTYDVSDSM